MWYASGTTSNDATSKRRLHEARPLRGDEERIRREGRTMTRRENTQDQERRDMSIENKRDAAEPSPASDGSVAIGEAQNMGYDEWYCKFYRCKACGNNDITDWFSFCPRCGRKIVWELGGDMPTAGG